MSNIEYEVKRQRKTLTTKEFYDRFSNFEKAFSSQFADLENVLSESNFPATKIAVGPFWERIVSVQPDKTPTTVIVHKSSISRFAILLSIIFNFLL